MPKWIHDRAEHLLAKNPSMSKSTAFAVATQQSHAKGKTPKSYGTKEGRQEAKAKFDKPKKEYEGKANPGKLESPKMAKVEEKTAMKKTSSLVGRALTGARGLGKGFVEGVTAVPGAVKDITKNLITGQSDSPSRAIGTLAGVGTLGTAIGAGGYALGKRQAAAGQAGQMDQLAKQSQAHTYAAFFDELSKIANVGAVVGKGLQAASKWKPQAGQASAMRQKVQQLLAGS